LASARLPQATTAAGGAVILLDSVSNTSISTYAPTANSVKTAYDAAIVANNNAAAANTRAASAQTAASDAFANAISANTRAASAQTAATAAYSNAVAFSANASNITIGNLALPSTSTISIGNSTVNVSLSSTTVLVNDLETTNAYSVGYKEVPQRITTTTYSLAISDAGKHVYNTNTTGTYAITVPNNTVVALPIGSAISIINGGNTITVAAGTNVTLRLAGSTSTGTRTLANNAVATVVKVATNTWYISGAGVT
jgi:hypothetical protein